MTMFPSKSVLRVSLLAGVGLALGLAACEPMFAPVKFPHVKWDDDGERIPVKTASGEPKRDRYGDVVWETEAVDEVKFAEGAVTVKADALNRGRETYLTYCASCHGRQGDGKGWSARGLVPPPRNFAVPFVVFKFAAVQANQLPRDADLMRTVKNGLHGSAMLPWDISDQRLTDVIQYIKTMSPRWRDEAPAEAIETSKDPFSEAQRAEAIALGENLYHTKTQCSQCHPAYVSQDKVNEFLVAQGKEPGTARPDAHWSVAKDSSYMLDGEPVNIVPPDFTWHELRSVAKVEGKNPAQVARAREDLYLAIAAGIGGTAMPTWKGSIDENELWALVHYVETLIALKHDDAKRSAFWAKLR